MILLYVCSLLLSIIHQSIDAMIPHITTQTIYPGELSRYTITPEDPETLIGKPVPDFALKQAQKKEVFYPCELVAIMDQITTSFVGMAPARYGIVKKKRKKSDYYIVIIEKNPETGTEVTETISKSKLWKVSNN